MTPEIIAVIVVVGLLSLAIGYLIAVTKAGKHQTETELALQQANDNVTQLTQNNDVVEAKLSALQEDHRSLELDNNTLVAQHEALKENYSSLEKTHKEVTDQLGEAVRNFHTAEIAKGSAQTELAENKKAQSDLQERLKHSDAVVLEGRKKLEEQAQQNAALDKQAKAAEVKAQETESKYQEQKKQHETLQIKLDKLQQQYTGLMAEHTQLTTSLSERDSSHMQQLAQFEEQKLALSEQFKVLANDILDAKSKALQENSKLSLSAVMTPFQQSIDSFKKEVQDIHHRETTQQGELRTELTTLKELNQKITTEAHELSTALRGQKKLQGNWGELVLENVLDRSGLKLGTDYKREVSITTEEGRSRPDVIIYLPQDKHLIIDAKVSLNAYTRFVNAEDELMRAQALKEHSQAIANRISELADKNYYKLPGLNSPEMVFMFIPIESAFVEALKADETLFQKAIENNVLVATPTTLLTSLNIVRQLWRYEDQNKHTALLASKAEGVFKKLNTFLSSFESIKKGLETATEAYVKAEGQLISGKGNLVKQVGEFKNLAPAIKAELPSYFTDKANLEIDFIPAEPNTDMLIIEIKNNEQHTLDETS